MMTRVSMLLPTTRRTVVSERAGIGKFRIALSLALPSRLSFGLGHVAGGLALTCPCRLEEPYCAT